MRFKRLSAISFALCGACLTVNAAFAAEDDAVAVINGRTLTAEDLQRYEQALQQQTPQGTAQSRDEHAILHGLIDRILLIQEGERQAVDETPELKREIATARDSLIARAMMEKFIEKNPISDEEVAARYDELILQMPTQQDYNASHILVETEADAVAAIEALNGGQAFEEVAKEKSVDQGSAQNGGSLGWVSPAQLVQPFADALKVTDKGTYTKQPVQTRYGWHVIRVDDVRGVEPPNLNAIRDRIVAMLRGERMQMYVQELREQSEIEVLKEVKKPAE